MKCGQENMHGLQTVIRLSIPAILAEVSSVMMQSIDAAMVGSLGSEEQNNTKRCSGDMRTAGILNKRSRHRTYAGFWK